MVYLSKCLVLRRACARAVCAFALACSAGVDLEAPKKWRQWDDWNRSYPMFIHVLGYEVSANDAMQRAL